MWSRLRPAASRAAANNTRTAIPATLSLRPVAPIGYVDVWLVALVTGPRIMGIGLSAPPRNPEASSHVSEDAAGDSGRERVASTHRPAGGTVAPEVRGHDVDFPG